MAEEKDRSDVIEQQFQHLNEKVDKGFQGVNERLDKLNGKVREHEEKHQNHELRFKDLEQSIQQNTAHRSEWSKWADRLWQALFSGALVLLVWILYATGILNPPSV